MLLRQRFSSLGVPVWHCDADGAVITQPEEPASIRRWLQSSAMLARVEKGTREAAQAAETQAFEVFPACWLIPIAEKQGIRRVGLIAAILFTESLFGTTDFEEICASAEMDSEEAKTLITPFLYRHRSDVDRTALVLEWTYSDLLRATCDRQVLEEFSEKLVQSYEETNLLFSLAGLMNGTSDPVQLVQTMCDRVHQVLPFKWLAIRFSQSSSEVPELAGQMLVAGVFPEDLRALRKTTADLLERGDADNWPGIMEPGRHELADLVQAEVLSEPIMHDGRIIGVVISGNKQGLDPDVCSVEVQFIRAAANYLGVLHENMARFAEQHALFTGLLRALAASIDAKDRYTCGHSERVGLLAAQMAAALGLNKEEIERYRIAGLLHDVGKIGIPEAVLCKTGRLTDDEFRQIKSHPGIGYTILRDVPAMGPIIDGVLHHHERWDGRGYPKGLAGEQIPLIARVLALADAFDAMSSTRSYRPAMPREVVLGEVQRCAGMQFDPALVPLFMNLDLDEFDEMLDRHQTRGAQAA